MLAGLGWMDAEVAELAGALASFVRLSQLDLSSNKIGNDGAKVLAPALAMSGLTSVDLSCNQLCGLDVHGNGTYTAEGITTIADALLISGGMTSVRWISAMNLSLLLQVC